MTDEERDELRAAKRGVTARLRRIDVTRYRLSDTDPRIEEYVTRVISCPEGHNLWEQLAVERFFRMADRYGIDRRQVLRFFTFYEWLYFPGKRGLQRYALTPVQAFQFASVYAFWDGSRRVVRECVLFVPRKFSKTTGSASFALYDLLYGDHNAETYVGANSQDQAKKCFDVIRGALRRLDPDGRRYVVNEQQIKATPGNPRKSLAQCLTANARTKDGLNASTVIMDEFSQARDSALLEVLTTSMGVRDNPLTVIITTASDVFTGPFYAMLQGYKEILLGKYEDDSAFIHLFEPDVDDTEDDPSTWRKVHPHMGVTVTEDFYASEWRKAQRNGATAKLAFRTKLLNLYTEDERKSWISSTMIRDHASDISIEGMKEGLPATIAIDLSVRDDFSAVTVGYYDPDEMHSYYITHYFLPRGAIEGHTNERLYRQWEAAGHLHVQEGDVIDYDQIVEFILGVAEHVELHAIGYDPYESPDCVNMLANTEVAYAVRPFSQTAGHYHSAVQSFEHALYNNRITVNRNPINYFCFGNAVLVEGMNGNLKPDKRDRAHKIDGVMTTLMAHKLFSEVVRFC